MGGYNGDGVIDVSDSRDLDFIQVNGGNEQRLDQEAKQTYSPSWSQDGRFILFVMMGES